MSASQNLRSLADEKHLILGAAVNRKALPKSESYRELLGKHFNTLVAENVMKPKWTQPQRGVFDYSAAQPLLDFADAYDQRVRGHTLCWHRGLPDWMKALDAEKDDVEQVLQDHVHGVADRFRNRVFAWDVINEVFNDEGWRDTVWYRAMGQDLLPKVFTWAHQHAPEAKLFYNDYAVEDINWKSDMMLDQVKRLLTDDIPIHGVGLQMHATMKWPKAPEIAENIARFTDLGLEVHITEMDVRIPMEGDEPADPAGYDKQAERYSELIEPALSNPKVTALLFWGFTDRVSWVPHHFKGMGGALLFDKDDQPKPAFHAVRQALETMEPRAV
jgi:endo-1,4-beta-xylanase